MVRPPLELWDTFACDVDGEPSTGVFSAPSGTIVALVRNRLVVRAPAREREGIISLDGSEMEVFSGGFEYEDVNIFAERSQRKGVAGVVWVEDPLQAMFFVGCDGSKGDRYVGVEWTDMEFLKLLLAEGERVGCVRPELAFLPTTTPLRFNQGDAAFAREHGLPVPRTRPGAAAPPRLMEVVQKWKAASI